VACIPHQVYGAEAVLEHGFNLAQKKQHQINPHFLNQTSSEFSKKEMRNEPLAMSPLLQS